MRTTRRRSGHHTHICASSSSSATDVDAGDWAALEAAIDRTPERSGAEVEGAMRALRDSGRASSWGSAADEPMVRRNVFMNEIQRAGVRDPEAIGKPSVRNDAAFLGTTVITTSVLATLAGVLLPGDWGFFSSYLIGGVALAVLAVGSTAPGLLQFAIDRFSFVFPDYKDRTLRHEVRIKKQTFVPKPRARLAHAQAAPMETRHAGVRLLAECVSRATASAAVHGAVIIHEYIL